MLKSNYMIFNRHIFLGMMLFLGACSTTQYLPSEKFLLAKNTIHVNGKKNKDKNLQNILLQKSNKKTLWLPLGLYFYNLGNENHKKDSEKWMANHPKTIRFLNAMFSYKKTKTIFGAYHNIQNWILKNGQAPVIFDKQKAEQTKKNLKNYFLKKGYFHAKVTYKTVLNVKKINVKYEIKTGKPYILDSIQPKISTQKLKDIYEKNKAKSFLKKGAVFDYENFKKEAERLLQIFRNKGFYEMTKNNIRFSEIDTLQKNHKTNVLLNIKNNVLEKNGKRVARPFKIQKIKQVEIITDYRFSYRNLPYKDSIFYKGYTFLSYKKLQYRPKSLLNAIFLYPDEIYTDKGNILSKIQLERLQNFKSIKIKYEPLNDRLLKAKIVLTPFKKYSIHFNTEAIHSNIKQIGLSGGITFLNRNFFKGAEMFKCSFQGSLFQLGKQNKNSKGILDGWDMNWQLSLEVPNFLSPFSEKIVNKKNNPKTNIYTSFNTQKNIGLDRERFSLGFGYSWQKGDFQNHKLEIMNLQYIRNLNTDAYFSIYLSEFEKIKNIQKTHFQNQPLSKEHTLSFLQKNLKDDLRKKDIVSYNIAKNVLNRRQIITNNYVVPKISYSFKFDNKNATNQNYQSLVSNLSISAGWLGKDHFFKVPISEFFKWDLEFKKFLGDWNGNVWAFRFFSGLIIPFDSNQEIPFPENFSAGGSNDIRAWKIYEVGLGRVKNDIEFKTGNCKLLANLEYRFKITKQIKGAFFVDAGNIWDISNSKLTSAGEKLQNFSDIKNIYLGTGLGIRYDFSFLIFRLDWAFKTYEPYLKNKKWFQNYSFNQSEFNFGINYPF